MGMFTRKGLSMAWARWCLVFLLCILGVASNAGAQVQTNTSIRGIVTDQTGSVVPSAKVVAREQNTGVTHSTTTKAGGSYSFPSLLPGTYTVTVTHPGFQTAVVTDQTVLAAQPAHVDITLKIGSTATSVTVSAAGTELLNTSSSQIASVISPRLVQSLPMNGLDYFDLTALTPGSEPQNVSTALVSYAGDQFVSAANNFVSTGVFLGGEADSATNVSVDGANAQSSVYQNSTQLQSPYDIEEVQVQTGIMNAEFGNGVSAVNVITKSGTNAYHGQIYEYLRNDALDATPFFTNLGNERNPHYDQNQFGGAFGGPIKKDKLFFFGDYEGYRLIQDVAGIAELPSAALLNGDFSGTATIYNPYRSDPTTGLREQFPGNVMPMGPTTLCSPRPTCADPVAVKFLDYIPQANGTFDGVPAFFGAPRTTMNRNQESIRVDWAKSEKALIYSRWTDYTGVSAANGLESNGGNGNPFSSQQAVVHWTESVSSSVVNDLMLAYSRPQWSLIPRPGVPDVSKAIGLMNTAPVGGAPDVTGVSVSLNTGYLFDYHATDNKIQVKDGLSWSKGKHNFKFGGGVINDRFIYPTLGDYKGLFEFGDNYATACPDQPACPAAQKAASLPTGGDSFADYLLGGYTLGYLSNSPLEYVGHQNYYGAYAQDSWRVNHKLTLNYGLRYEYWSPWTVPSNTTASFNFATGNIEYALQNPLDYLSSTKCFGGCAPLNPAIPRQGYKVGNLGFAPRIGLAYAVNPKTVVRAGYGIYYDGNGNNNDFSELQSRIPPFEVLDEYTQDLSVSAPQNVMNGLFPPPEPEAIPEPNSTPPAAFSFVYPVTPVPSVNEWTINVQRQINSFWSAEVDYLGSHTYHERQAINENLPALPQGPYAGLSLQARRPYPQWGNLSSEPPIGWDKYNALYVSLRNREWHGLSLISNWSWAKDITTGNPIGGGGGSEDFRAPYIYAGPAQITPTQTFNAGYAYLLPLGRGQRFVNSSNSVLGKILGGWTISGIITFNSGIPGQVTAPDQSNTGNTGYPNRVAGCNPNNVPGGKTRFEWFNTSCFVLPAIDTYGNSTIGSITNPGVNNWDMAILKDTHTDFPKESGDLQFRVEFFNAFNHTQWGVPGAVLTTTSTYGEISSTRPARIIPFVLQNSF